jgi:hypothetical protein
MLAMECSEGATRQVAPPVADRSSDACVIAQRQLAAPAAMLNVICGALLAG